MKLSTFLPDGSNNRTVWITAAAVSLLLLGLVVAQIDWRAARAMASRIDWGLLGIALVLLFFEGVFAAARIALFTGQLGRFAGSLQANAWYVILLVMLPARLGEVAAIFVFERFLEMKRGAAAISIIAQRLYDVMVLSVLFFIALLGLAGPLSQAWLAIAALAVIGIAVAVLYYLGNLLTGAFLLMRRAGLHHGGLTRQGAHLLLQARLWSRQAGARQSVVLGGLGLTFLKWVSNLSALVLLLMALHLPISFFQAMSVSAAYNFLAVIPLQTIGGIGVGEAGLTLLLVVNGLTASDAASASIMLRIVIILFPFLFWAVVMSCLRLRKAGLA